MIVKEVMCRYCGRPAKLIRDKGNSLARGLIWYCPICMAQAPAKSYSHAPVGIMAKGDLRLRRSKLYELIANKKYSSDPLSKVLMWIGAEADMPVSCIEDMDETQVAKALDVMGKVERGERPWM